MVSEAEIAEYLLGWRIEQSQNNLKADSELSYGKLSHSELRLCEPYNLNELERKIAAAALKLVFETGETGISATEAVEKVCSRDFIPLSQKVGAKISRVCNSLLSGFGPLDPLIEDENIEEISLSGIGEPLRVFIAGKGWAESGLVFTSEACVFHLINKISAATGRRLTISTPILNSFLPNGSRLHAVSGQISSKPTFTLRKFRTVPFTLGNLVENKTISNAAADFLRSAVASGLSMVIAGNTGSGKTTLLNAVLSTLPSQERFVMVEDVSEISLPRHEHKIRLLADTNAGITLNQLVYESLRMRPDRLVVSEIRNEEEVKAFSNALLSGPGKSCFATFHANSASEALRRLHLLGFREFDLDSIGLIVVQKRIGSGSTEKRRVTEIAAVKDGKPNVLFQYSALKDGLTLTPAGKAFIRGFSE